MSTRIRVLLIHQRLTLPWIFDSAEHAGIDLVLVPRADERIDPAQLPPAVHELLSLNVNDPAGALDVLRARHATAPFDGVFTLYEPSVPFAAAVARELGLPGLLVGGSAYGDRHLVCSCLPTDAYAEDNAGGA